MERTLSPDVDAEWDDERAGDALDGEITAAIERPPRTMRSALIWTLASVFWFAAVAWSISIRMRSDRPLVEATVGGPEIVAGVVSIGFLAVAVVGARRIAAGRAPFAAHRVGPIVVYLVQAAGFILLALGLAMVIVARAGHAITVTPAPSQVTEGEVFGSLVWHAARAVPLLELPTSLGWENPVPDPGWALGVAHVLIRAVFAGVLASTAVLLWKTWRKGPRSRRQGLEPA